MRNNVLCLVAAAAVLFVAFPSYAQNLDPTVEVSRDYEGKLLVLNKPILDMAVPDSVYRFDLDFDYSVTDTPYKGAYEFVPYSVDMALASKPYDRSTMYLKAGAGYQLRPSVDLLWSPSFKAPFRLDVFGKNRSYIGSYSTMSSPLLVEKETDIVSADHDKPDWSGMDFSTNAGVNGRYDWDNALFTFGADYLNLLQSQDVDIYGIRVRVLNSAGLNFGFASKAPHSAGIDYNVALRYRFLDDQMNDTTNGEAGVRSNDLDFGLNVESVLSGGHNMKIDASFGMTHESKFFNFTAASLNFAPHYVIKTSRWTFNLGVRLATVFRTDGKSVMYSHKEQVIYPDCTAEYMLFPDFLKVYAAVTGNSTMNTYSSLVRDNRRVNPYYGRGVWNLLDVTDEKLSAELGFEGRVTSRFGYTLKGGYKIYGNAPLPTLYVPDSKAGYLPGLGYAPYHLAFASLDFLLDTEMLRVDGNLRFDGVTYVNREFATIAGFVFPAPFRGDISFLYDFNDRIYAGVDCEFSSASDGQSYKKMPMGGRAKYYVTVPAYADLGVNLEYRTGRKMSFWARGGNLLGMTIQRELLYAEKGPYFTAGICLNL